MSHSKLVLRHVPGTSATFQVIIAGALVISSFAALFGAAAPAYVVCVDSGENMINSQVMLGSVVKHVDYTVGEAMYEVAGGEFAFGSTTVGFDDGATEFIYNPTLLRRRGDPRNRERPPGGPRSGRSV